MSGTLKDMSLQPRHQTILSSPKYSLKQHTEANVPFAWELKPGVAKPYEGDTWHLTLQLPPPPSRCKTDRCYIDYYYSDVLLESPVVVCPSSIFQSSSSRFSRSKRMSFRKNIIPEDPFLTAYRNCSENGKDHISADVKNSDKMNNKKKKKKSVFAFISFSCMYPGSVSVSQAKTI